MALVYIGLVFWLLGTMARVQAVGVSWSTSSAHPLPPPTVVNLLESNKVSRVKLLEADPSLLQALSATGIRVMVGIPNSMLRTFNLSKKAAESWVHDNITRFSSKDGVQIEYIAVGNEPFLQSYAGQFQPFVVGAATNIQSALIEAKLANKIKVVVPCNFDIIYQQSNSSLPSKAHFRSDLNKTMLQLVSFLAKHKSPFVINLYPFLNHIQNKNRSIDYTLFQSSTRPLIDGHNSYKNSFDASVDMLVTALSKAGYADMDIIIGQIGWPTDGSPNTSVLIARTFMKGLLNHLESKTGTPLRPHKPPMEVYIFSLLDEDERSITNGNFERHWGVFTFDGQAKYQVDLGQGSLRDLSNAQNVEYFPSKWCVVNNNNVDLLNSNASASALEEACSSADCTAMLTPGGSCFNMSWPANISYAFNTYYQQKNQRADSCDFGGLGLITTVDPSVDNCRFFVGINTSSSNSVHGAMIVCMVGLLVNSLSPILDFLEHKMYY